MILATVRARSPPFLPCQVMVRTFCMAFGPGTCTVLARYEPSLPFHLHS